MVFAWPCLPTGQKWSSDSSVKHSPCVPRALQLSYARKAHGFTWCQCGLVCSTDVLRAPAEEWYTEALILIWHSNKTWLQPVEGVWGKSQNPWINFSLWLNKAATTLSASWYISCSWQWELAQNWRVDVHNHWQTHIHVIAWLHASK